MDRQDALQLAESRFPHVAARFETVYGMRLPRHVTYAAAFFLGLQDDERDEAWQMDAAGLFGVGEWFLDGALDKTAYADERVHGRFRRDPPEMISFISGNSDGSHWGLWYDDPNELPRVCAHNWARDSAETSDGLPTLLASVKRRVDERDDDDDEERSDAWARTYDWLAQMVAREREAHRKERIAAPEPRTHDLVGGMDPIGVDVPVDLLGYAASRARYDAYRANAPEVLEQILSAKAELLQGKPGRALVIGRELHWFDADETRDACTELLTKAYRALGRDALAGVVEAHHAARDMPTVDVYSFSSSPFMLAVRRENVAAVRAGIDDPMVEDEWIEAAARQTEDPDLQEVLFAKLPKSVLAALGMALWRASPRDNEHGHQAAARLRAALDAGKTLEEAMQAALDEKDYGAWRMIRDQGEKLDVERWDADARRLLERALELGIARESIARELELRGMSTWALEQGFE